MITIIRENRRNRKFTIVLLAVLFFVVFLGITFTVQTSQDLSENNQPDGFLSPEANNFLECPIEKWNMVETDSVPFENFKVIKRWDHRRRVNPFHPVILNALLFNEYIMIIIDTKNMSGHSVICRYYDCLRREMIPSQFVSKIYPESVVYCPRRVGVHWISITGNRLEKPERLTAIEKPSGRTGIDNSRNIDNLRIRR